MAVSDKTANSERRREAVDAVIRAVRTGEHSAAMVAMKFLAAKVVMSANGVDLANRDAVIDRISGQWAFTPVLAQGEWSLPTGPHASPRSNRDQPRPRESNTNGPGLRRQ